MGNIRGEEWETIKVKQMIRVPFIHNVRDKITVKQRKEQTYSIDSIHWTDVYVTFI